MMKVMRFIKEAHNTEEKKEDVTPEEGRRDVEDDSTREVVICREQTRKNVERNDLWKTR